MKKYLKEFVVELSPDDVHCAEFWLETASPKSQD